MIAIAKPLMGEPEAQAARRAILSGWITQGPEVAAFEHEFAQYTGATHACAVSNCTTALHLALIAAGVKEGDEVVTVSHSYIATANSILLVTFANDERGEGKNAIEAAISAGHTRLRPVVMTALAMIIGMLPMSLGLGEGGEQNAPLGRAVIGGLLMATVATLFFVPVIYSFLRKKEFAGDPDEQFEKEANREYEERKA